MVWTKADLWQFFSICWSCVVSVKTKLLNQCIETLQFCLTLYFAHTFLNVDSNSMDGGICISSNDTKVLNFHSGAFLN